MACGGRVLAMWKKALNFNSFTLFKMERKSKNFIVVLSSMELTLRERFSQGERGQGERGHLVVILGVTMNLHGLGASLREFCEVCDEKSRRDTVTPQSTHESFDAKPGNKTALSYEPSNLTVKEKLITD